MVNTGFQHLVDHPKVQVKGDRSKSMSGRELIGVG
jgi:hypothetical protein